MTEATWNDATKTPDIDWRMSAALEDMPRGDTDVAEVTSLEGAVRAWKSGINAESCLSLTIRSPRAQRTSR